MQNMQRSIRFILASCIGSGCVDCYKVKIKTNYIHQPYFDKMEENSNIFNFFIYNLSKDPEFTFSSYCEEFNELKTNLQRMNFVYQDMMKCKACPSFKEDEKSDFESTKLREQGNKYHRAGKYREALDCYTRSILNAKSKETRALAYANRSEALFKLQLYSETLTGEMETKKILPDKMRNSIVPDKLVPDNPASTDIDRVFKSNYPDQLKARLVARQKSAKTEKGITINYHEPVPKILESEKNSQIQCARNCIQIMNNEQYGRHIVATRNIEIGEILAVEPPYAAIISDDIYVHCHECFELCYNMIPCNKCTKALYCGQICKDKAFDKYHKYECPILYALDLFQIDFPKRLALKIVFMSKNEWDVHNSDQLETTEYRSDRFKEMYGLLNHIEKRTVENLLARTTIACGFFHLIRNHTTFLQNYTNEDRLKEMLLSMVLNCGTNTVGLDELSPTGTNPLEFNNLCPIATAIYTFFTMFNHSCWPNVYRNFYGSSMVLRATNTISQGEQCFICYGPRSSTHSKDFRQNFLSQHQFFTCTCRACEENWPMDVYMQQELHTLKMSTIMKLQTFEVDVAKNELKRLLIEVKKAEKLLPPSHNYTVKDLLLLCYNVFGNKRRFL